MTKVTSLFFCFWCIWAAAVIFPAFGGEIQGESIPGLPYEKFQIPGSTGNPVTFYLTHPSSPAPLVVAIQGYGCTTLFQRDESGSYTGDMPVLIKKAAGDRLTVLVVEKPHALSLKEVTRKVPQSLVSSERGCTTDFLKDFTLESWEQSILAAVEASRSLPWVKPGRVFVIGWTEGALMAAKIARDLPAVTDVAILSGYGVSPAWTVMSRTASASYKTKEEYQRAVAEKEKEIIDVAAHPDRIDRWTDNYTYHYVASLFKAFPADDLLNSNARVYIAHGMADGYSPIASVEVLNDTLIANNRNVVMRRIPGADFKLTTQSDDGSPKAFEEIVGEYERAVDWFFTAQ